MYKIKRGDIVQVIQGADKGKKGKVLTMFTRDGRALVEGIKLVKKHKRKTQQDQQGGVVSIESPIVLSKLALFCKSCNRPARVKFSILKDGTKTRVCKECNEVI